VLAEAPRAGVEVLPLELPAVAAGFPYAEKAFAAAQVETLVAAGPATMAWTDTATLVLGEPAALDLAGGGAVALRPVSLVNRVGIAPEAPVDGYWTAIYREAGVDPATVPAVRAVVDAAPVRFFVNCEIIAFRPGAGSAASGRGRSARAWPTPRSCSVSAATRRTASSCTRPCCRP